MSRKLLIISQRFWPEEIQINEIAKYFAENDVKVDVLCGKPNYPEGRFYEGYSAFGQKKEQYGNITVYRAAEIKKQGAFQMRPLLNYVSFGIFSSFCLRKFRNNQYDAVFVYQTSPVFLGRAGLKLAVKRRIRSVMYVKDLWPDAVYKEMDIRDPLLKKIFKAVSYSQYKKAGRLITSSKETERYLVRHIAQSPGEVSYVAPFPAAAFVPAKKDDRIMQRFIGSFALLYVGEVSSKGPFGMFIRAAQRLIGMGLRDIIFIIVGDGDGLNDLKKEIDRRALYDTIFLEGKIAPEDLSGYFYAADALVCADMIDDASISYKPPEQVINYTATGKPVLAAVDGEGKEIIRKAGCGLVSEPEDEDGFFDNIIRLYKTPKEELRQMGQKGKLYQLRNYNFETTMENIMQIVFPEK